MNKVLGITLFKLGWFACVFGPGQGLLNFLPLLVLFIIFVNYKFIIKNKFSAMIIHALTTLLGIGMDFLLLETGVYESTVNGPIIPTWLFYIWLIFPLNYFHYFDFLIRKKWLTFFFGLIGGPLAYSAGPAVGLLKFNSTSLYIIGLSWGIYLSISMFLIRIMRERNHKY